MSNRKDINMKTIPVGTQMIPITKKRDSLVLLGFPSFSFSTQPVSGVFPLLLVWLRLPRKSIIIRSFFLLQNTISKHFPVQKIWWLILKVRGRLICLTRPFQTASNERSRYHDQSLDRCGDASPFFACHQLFYRYPCGDQPAHKHILST